MQQNNKKSLLSYLKSHLKSYLLEKSNRKKGAYMNFINFVNTTKEMVEEILPRDVAISVTSVQKNNGVKLDGLCISEPNKNIAPTIYLNDYYEKYLEGMEMLDIIEEINDIYRKSKVEKSIDVDFFTDFSKAQKKIVYKIIHAKKNEELLEKIPHIPFLDLAIVFYCIVVNEAFGNAVIQITNSHLELWKTQIDKVYECAWVNTPKLLPYELISMEQMIQSFFMEETGDSSNCHFASEDVPMYVLSNRTHLNGAAAILYPDLLKDFAKSCGCNLFILPSSIHEVILIPAKNEEIERLNEMVQEVNRTQLVAEEILSDHIYIYDLEQDIVENCV